MTNLTDIFSALADETRLALVEHLMANGEQPAGALTELADISAPAVSRHLKVLRAAGLIEQRVAGTHRYYRVSPKALAGIHNWTMDHRAFWDASLERLDGLLALDPKGDTE